MTGTEEFDEEVMDLPVARYTRPTFELAPGAHRFLDVFLVWRHNNQDGFSFPFVPTRDDRIYLRRYGCGSYRVEVIVNAHNISAKKRVLDWHWSRDDRATIPVN